ncbi:MAG: threonine/serine exporter family protein [Thermoclostridium sp.]|nr:threonine/serine exporter family protein [Thermoclostridium sp.]
MTRFIVAFIGSLCPAVLINVDRKNLIWAGLAGMIGRFMNDWLLLLYPSAALVSVFLGAAAVAIYSEVMARVRKTPSTIFSIPGVFPLVPGVDAYRTIQSLTEADYSAATAFGVSAVAKAILIAFSILIVSSVFRKVKLNRRKKAKVGA